MNIDFNRICKLAGLNSSGSKSIISESVDYSEASEQEESQDEMVADTDEAMMYEEEESGDMHEEEESGDMHEEDENEMVEVDIAELMNEIRRAKAIMKKNKSDKRKIQENALKRTIAKEVASVLKEMEDHDSTWLYGKKKPRHSKKGHSNQGRTLPGIGFRKN